MNIKLISMNYKFYVNLFFILAAMIISGPILAKNFSHINTFGYDYIDFGNDTAQADWIARKHDWLIGPQAGNLTFNGNRVLLSTYNTVKNANPDTKIMVYSPFHTVLPHMMQWLESWCAQNGRDPESLYYHYFMDTTINTTQGQITVPGYGSGTASSLKDARVRARWWGGQYPNVDPSSQTFRDAFTAMLLAQVTILGTTDKYADGLFLDTYTGTTETGYWSVHLENTIEMKNLGISTEAAAVTKVNKDLADIKVQIETALKAATGNNAFVVVPNADSPGEMYNAAAGVYETYKSSFNNLAIEFLISTTSGTTDIPNLKKVYDDLESGRHLWIRSQTNYETGVPYGFTKFILATHYLINHSNAYFFYHQGSASNYGGTPAGNLRTSHWHQNMEIDIGQPVSRPGNDYWGVPNTNRFFIFAQGANYTILGREYSNALVLAKFANSGSFANIGSNPTAHALPDTYYPLQADNTLGTATRSVTLGNSEGIILLKSATTTTPSAPQTSNLPPTPMNLSIRYDVLP